MTTDRPGSDAARRGGAPGPDGFPGPAIAASLPERARRLVEALRADGHAVWLVGGCLRDAWLLAPATQGVPGVEASGGVRAGAALRDLDLATAARPEHVGRLATALEPVLGSVHEANPDLGSYRWRGWDGLEVAVTSLRTESGYSDHRRPENVVFVDDVAADARRRDFTVNALYAALPGGEMVDPLGAARDVAARCLRTIGDPAVRLLEDPVRLLRAVRYACRCNLALERDTAAVLAERGAEGLAHLTRGRVRIELESTLAGPRAARAWGSLSDLGWLGVLMPAHAGDPRAVAWVGRALARGLGSRGRGELWATVLAPLGAEAAGRALADLALPRGEAADVARVLELVRAARAPGREPPGFVARPAGSADEQVFETALRLAWDLDFAASRIETWQDVHRVVVRCSGADVVARGVRPGPAVGRILDEFRSRALAAGLDDDDAAASLLSDLARAHQGPR